MKTAVSLPDRLFRRAEQLANQLGIPRSQLYARAIDEFLQSHSDEAVTAALDEMYKVQASGLEPGLADQQAAVVSEEDW